MIIIIYKNNDIYIYLFIILNRFLSKKKKIKIILNCNYLLYLLINNFIINCINYYLLAVNH